MTHPTHQCGSCTACCTVLGVPEIGKETYTPCPHLRAAGCGVYSDRPGSCRTFECQWLRGMLEVDGSVDTGLRPDSCGVIFAYQPATPFGDVYEAWEVEAGASASGPAKSIIEGLAERFLVVITARAPSGEEKLASRELVGPPHLVARAADVLWSWRAERGPDGGDRPIGWLGSDPAPRSRA